MKQKKKKTEKARKGGKHCHPIRIHILFASYEFFTIQSSSPFLPFPCSNVLDVVRLHTYKLLDLSYTQVLAPLLAFACSLFFFEKTYSSPRSSCRRASQQPGREGGFRAYKKLYAGLRLLIVAAKYLTTICKTWNSRIFKVDCTL